MPPILDKTDYLNEKLPNYQSKVQVKSMLERNSLNLINIHEQYTVVIYHSG